MSEITRKTALLVGNGFSINFDSDYANIYERLFDNHKIVLKNYKINHNNKAIKSRVNDNLTSLKQFMYRYNKESFEKIFNDGIKFAEFILNNPDTIKNIRTHIAFNELKFGVSHLTVIDSIHKVGSEKGYRYVNIENWTSLVWIYFILQDIGDSGFSRYANQVENGFIKLIKVSNINRTPIFAQDEYSRIVENFIFNGFIQYYKFLMASTIFNNGKSMDLNKLNRIDNIRLDGVVNFINQFEVLLTLNYDHIMENITGREVNHLHGEFQRNKVFYVNHQMQALIHNSDIINISDLKIGDYIFAKAAAPTMYNDVAKKDGRNTELVVPTTMIPDLIKANSLNHIFLFGMNVENDFHILRGIMLGLCENEVVSPKVTYCHFNEEEKKSFEDTWYKVITFGKEYSEYSRGIELEFLDSKQIINDHFLIKEKIEQ